GTHQGFGADWRRRSGPRRVPSSAPGQRDRRLCTVSSTSAGGGRPGRALNVPNVLSMLRLVGVPVFLWAILTGQDLLALLVLMGSGVTDYLDGKIARRYN